MSDAQKIIVIWSDNVVEGVGIPENFDPGFLFFNLKAWEARERRCEEKDPKYKREVLVDVHTYGDVTYRMPEWMSKIIDFAVEDPGDKHRKKKKP